MSLGDTGTVRRGQIYRSTELNGLADDPSNVAAGAADLTRLLSDPGELAGFLEGTSVAALFAQAYRRMVTLPSATNSYREMYTQMADADQRPVLFHCTTGKDRTGWAPRRC